MSKSPIYTIFIIIFLLWGPMRNATGNEEGIFYENFEVNKIDNWELWSSGEGNITAEISSTNPRNGSQSLHTVAIPDGFASANLQLDINYDNSFGIDFQVFSVQNSASVQVTFDSVIEDGHSYGLTLAYGPHAQGENTWWNGAYRIQVDFPVGEWVRIDRDFAPDIAEALSHPLSQFTEYNAAKILTISIYAWNYGGDVIYENYFDDLIITDQPNSQDSSTIQTFSTTQTSSTVGQPPQTNQSNIEKTTTAPPDSEISSSVVLGSFTLFTHIIAVIIYYKRFR